MAKHRYLLPVIEDSVQLWHFVQLVRKYGSIIAEDDVLYDSFRNRAIVAKDKHVSSQKEKEGIDETLEELDEIKLGKIKVVREIKPVTKIEKVHKEADAGIHKKPYTLLRSVHSLLVEMDARLRRLEDKITSSTDH